VRENNWSLIIQKILPNIKNILARSLKNVLIILNSKKLFPDTALVLIEGCFSCKNSDKGPINITFWQINEAVKDLFFEISFFDISLFLLLVGDGRSSRDLK